MALGVRSRSAEGMLRAALAAATMLALAACAGMEAKPDKPFKTADVCLDSTVPAGWIRTNDWRGKGCGIDAGDAQAKSAAAAHDRGADIQLASASDPPKVKPKAKSKPVDISRGVNAVAESGPNNWMTIAEIAHTRIGRSLTVCAGAVPEGWIETARYWDKGRCGNPTKQSEKNVMLIERMK